jgi:hypothetical protein
MLTTGLSEEVYICMIAVLVAVVLVLLLLSAGLLHRRHTVQGEQSDRGVMCHAFLVQCLLCFC